ncbi:hypothetical protein K438DRAFT_1902267 [Mycena galopus ATCC 62051]|nr:hypothetical protein K438DRAFT_1902267 [Mycena galopus ATCC 62051]
MLDIAQTYSNELTAAAQIGDLATLRNLLGQGAEVSERGDDDITPLMAAATAGRSEAVTLLLDNGADAKVRDVHGRTVIKLALDRGKREIAQALADRHSDMIVTDPRLPKGEAWLRGKFRSISDNVKDPASKPDRTLWERLISGNLGPTEGRNASDVYWEHIGLCLIGDRPLDIERNYSKNLKQCRMGTFNQFFEGHEGIRQSAKLLHSKLPTTQYDIVETVVKQTNKTSGWVTERWGYYDPQNEVQVTDGIDTFLIENGKITVKWANYNVEDKVDPRSVYEEKVGISGTDERKTRVAMQAGSVIRSLFLPSSHREPPLDVAGSHSFSHPTKEFPGTPSA